MTVHKTILLILYTTGIVFVAGVTFRSFDYYRLPSNERPHSPLHQALKPGGSWGHGFGIVGSSMMLLLFLYSARKRELCGLRFGKIRYWLNIHIFFGIMGPILVTLHTSFKFGGIVAVSYFSMIAVMLSGFVGRYLYVQIPRALSGDELTMKEMEEKNKLMTRLLIERYQVDAQTLQQIQTLSDVGESKGKKGLGALWLVLKSDLKRPFRIRALRRQMHRQMPQLSGREIDGLIALAVQKSILMRKMAFLSSIQPLFFLWHVVHKPFAYVMIIIMFIHIAVTLAFGYRWIF